MTTAAPRRDIRAILFDKDGTLIDFQASWGPYAARLIQDFAQEVGIVADDVARALGVDLSALRFHPDSPVIAGTPDDLVTILRQFAPDYDDQRLLDTLSHGGNTPDLVPVAGLMDTCIALHGRGIKLGVVTNDFEQDARNHLANLGLTPLFEVVIGYDSGFGAKPEPNGCLAAAAQLGVSPEACLMVGDSLHDIRAGARAGMQTVGVLTGVAGVRELSAHADIVLADISHLHSWLMGETF